MMRWATPCSLWCLFTLLCVILPEYGYAKFIQGHLVTREVNTDLYYRQYRDFYTDIMFEMALKTVGCFGAKLCQCIDLSLRL